MCLHGLALVRVRHRRSGDLLLADRGSISHFADAALTLALVRMRRSGLPGSHARAGLGVRQIR
jgi:hypothetical protein